MRSSIDSTKFIWLDGNSVVLLLNIFGYSIPRRWRLTFLDWQTSFFESANRLSLNIYLLGSKNERILLVENILSNKYANIRFRSHHGYFDLDSPTASSVIEDVNHFKTDILLVGMGMPRQENWILINKKNLNAKVIMPIGGYYEYLAGEYYTPPRWSGRWGVEWFFRLASKPVNLFSRYLIEPWSVLYHLTLYAIKK
jgi:N-acetylglucosaminyldiphosphoundecaprenol N-acetyl-beta-D-mannosaminyltransferase